MKGKISALIGLLFLLEGGASRLALAAQPASSAASLSDAAPAALTSDAMGPANPEPMGPSCEVCGSELNAAVRSYVAALMNSNNHDIALHYLESCQKRCSAISCQLSLLYEESGQEFIEKNHIARKTIRETANVCKKSSQDSEIKAVDADSDRRTAKLDSIWRKANRPIWAGYGLVAAGAVLSVTSAVLMGLAAKDKLPSPVDCEAISMVQGDICVVNFSDPGVQAGLSLPLALGIGGITTGIVLLSTF